METKKCSRCRKTKEIKEFNWRNKAKGVKSTACKICTRLQSKRHHENNKQYYNDKAKRINDARRANNRKQMLLYLSEHFCIDCGEADRRCLTFDHVEGKKVDNVSMLVHRNSWETVLAEIKKCVVRCANCHMKKTANDFGYYTAL